jgi:hypothetical protein
MRERTVLQPNLQTPGLPMAYESKRLHGLAAAWFGATIFSAVLCDPSISPSSDAPVRQGC